MTQLGNIKCSKILSKEILYFPFSTFIYVIQEMEWPKDYKIFQPPIGDSEDGLQVEHPVPGIWYTQNYNYLGTDFPENLAFIKDKEFVWNVKSQVSKERERADGEGWGAL